MLHGLNLMEFDSWTDSDMKILQACKTFNTIVHDAHWLQVAADLMHMCDNGYHEISMEGASGDFVLQFVPTGANTMVLRVGARATSNVPLVRKQFARKMASAI